MTTALRSLTWSALLALSVCAPAQAQKKPATGSAKPTVAHQSREEYRSCLNEKDALKTRDKELSDAVGQHSDSVKRLKALAAEIAETQKTLNKADQAAVNQSNVRIDEYNQLAPSVNARAKSLQTQQDALDADWDRYNEACADKPVLQSDVDAVMKERKAAGK